MFRVSCFGFRISVFGFHSSSFGVSRFGFKPESEGVRERGRAHQRLAQAFNVEPGFEVSALRGVKNRLSMAFICMALICNGLDLHHKSPDSMEHQYKSRA